MIGRKYVIGLAILALALGALAAANASAEQRAYSCTKTTPTKEFSDAHCLNKTEPKEFGHALVTEEHTNVSLSNQKTASGTSAAAVMLLKGQLPASITFTVQCTGANGVGTLSNAAASATFEGTITYTGCTITAPAGKGCVITGGTFTTQQLAATTKGQASNTLKFEPAPGGTQLATLPISNCKEELIPAGNYPLTGTFVATTSGATITTAHSTLTTQNTLILNGIKAGIEGALTISREEPSVSGESIALTTTIKQQAYTCSKGAATKEFNDAHCLNAAATKEYGHAPITEENAKVTASSEKTAGGTTAGTTAKLKGQLGGVATEVQCSSTHATGTLTNAAVAVNGEGILEYSGCSVTAPAGKGCEVVGGTITTETLSASTTGLAASMLKLTPQSPATKFALVSIEHCAGGVPADGSYPVTGSLVVEASGATVTTTHAGTTTQGSLKFGGVTAGLEGALTVSREGGDPIVLTSTVQQHASTCSQSAASKTFGDAHCLSAGGIFGHTLITAENEPFIATNNRTASGTTAASVFKLNGQISGVVTEVQCKAVHGTGTLTNAAESAGGEGVLEFSSCSVPLPAGRGCEVTGGTVTTKKLAATTAGLAATKLSVEPAPGEGTQFATVPIKGCSENIPPANSYLVTGKVTVNTSGGTATTTHADVTTQNQLKFGGVKAGIEAALTIGKEEGELSVGAITFT